MKNIFWFRRDLRLEDNIGLYHALADSNEVIPTFIISKSFINSPEMSSARVFFLFDCLHDLAEQLNKLGSKLIIRFGNPEYELIKLAKEQNAQGIYFNKAYENEEIAEEKNIINLFAKSGYRVKSFKDQVIFEEKEIPVQLQKGELTFKNYKTKWLKKVPDENIKAITILEKDKIKFIKKVLPIDSIINPKPKDYGYSLEAIYLKGGETQAKKIFDNIISGKSYLETKYLDIWSKISPYIRFGAISHRKVMNYLLHDINFNYLEKNILEKVIDNIIKTEYLYSKFFNNEKNEFKKDNIQNNWDIMYNNFFLWCNGSTGYPIIDTAMRQLTKESCIHNNLKVISINFFINNLKIDAKWGQKHFLHKLIDGDSILNRYEWSEISELKVKNFSSITESKKFDKNGKFIRKFISELESVPDRYIHEPYKMPISLQNKIGCNIGINYPIPCIKGFRDEIERVKLYLDD